MKSIEGRQVRVEINSGYPVTIFYNGTSIQAPSRAKRLLTYRAGQWRAEIYDVAKMALLDATGDYLSKLFQLNYSTIRLRSENYNWIKTVVLPKAPPEGSTVLVEVQSNWPVEVSYNGRISLFGTWAYPVFVFRKGVWVMN